MKVILVPVADRPECLPALNAAFDIADRLDANVIGCHVRAHREESPPDTRRTPLSPDEWSNVLADVDPEEISLRSKAAAILFESRARSHDFMLMRKARLGARRNAIWREMMGTPSRVLSIVGPLADLIVMPRPGPRDRGRGKSFLLAALMHAGQPVLVLPPKWKKPIGTRVMIAWNQGREAAHTVSATRALLRLAEDVSILSCGKENRPGPKATYLTDYLKLLGIKSRRLSTPGRDVNLEIEGAFAEQGANLLLMGGYSRGRLRELVLGGVTEHMLFRSRIPVLMLHR